MRDELLIDRQGETPALKLWLNDLGELLKVRLNTMVLFSTAIGFYFANPPELSFLRLLHLLLGVALVSGSASALNQVWERTLDAKMNRTRMRPLPSGRFGVDGAIVLALITGGMGLYLLLITNMLCALLTASTWVLYCFAYTPLKQVTSFNTIIGAIPGAMPPLIGWTAATGSIETPGLILFGILFFWQLPHFFAIGWIYKEDYAKAGFQILPTLYPNGKNTGFHCIAYSMLLLPIALLPGLLHLCGFWYLAIATLLGIAFIYFSIQFTLHPTTTKARHLFFYSLIYLPVLLATMAFDRS